MIFQQILDSCSKLFVYEFASLLKWIMFIVIPAPWNFDDSEDRLLARDLY